MWQIKIKRKLQRKIEALPQSVQDIFADLKMDLEHTGPVQPGWKNYSKLGKNKHHCHLTYHYAACWEVDENNVLTMEVYYVGSRENAPY